MNRAEPRAILMGNFYVGTRKILLVSEVDLSNHPFLGFMNLNQSLVSGLFEGFTRVMVRSGPKALSKPKA